MKDSLADACLDCPAGFYCVNDKSQDPEPCPQGFYCPVKTGFNWKPCPKGTYGDRSGLSNVTSKWPSPIAFQFFLRILVIVSIDVTRCYLIKPPFELLHLALSHSSNCPLCSIRCGKVLLGNFFLIGYTLGFDPQTQQLNLPWPKWQTTPRENTAQ